MTADGFVLLNDLAVAMGLDKSSFRRLVKRSGMTIHKVYSVATDNQTANAIPLGDVPTLFAFLESRGYGKAGHIVGADVARGLVESWRDK